MFSAAKARAPANEPNLAARKAYVVKPSCVSPCREKRYNGRATVSRTRCLFHPRRKWRFLVAIGRVEPNRVVRPILRDTVIRLAEECACALIAFVVGGVERKGKLSRERIKNLIRRCPVLPRRLKLLRESRHVLCCSEPLTRGGDNGGAGFVGHPI